tara:strand:+ start:10706 stop:12184 length:1479 start_codon:yes stop_codon:yes gene_type:complete
VTSQTIVVPDLGGAEEVEVIEVSVAVGDQVAVDQTLVVLESDKAMMEIPAPSAGKVLKLFVKEGDKIAKAGDVLVEMEVSAEDESSAEPSGEPSAESTAAPAARSTKTQSSGSPDSIDGEIEAKSTSPGIARPAVPEDARNNVTDVVPDVVPETVPQVARGASPGASAAQTSAAAPHQQTDQTDTEGKSSGDIYAGPAVRQLARELGVNLLAITGTGPRGRLLKEDVQGFVKTRMVQSPADGQPIGGPGIPAVPDTDFSQFGEIEQVAMSKIGKLTAANMHRSWLNVPHVTQFDDADITELELFRQSLKSEGEARGVKMTPVPIILKACAAALANNPVLNRSLVSDGEHYIQKHYIHIGMAVDTSRGLLVPVIRDVDKKTLWQLAAEVAELAIKARDGKLTANEMQGGCFTVSSLGAIGGMGFTPVVNTPQVAILGVSKAQIKPVWNGSEFAPRNMLPLSLSYDHRMVNGGDAGRFMTELVNSLGDIRRLLL